MSSTILERVRAYHEDIEQYEDACAELLVEEAQTYRENILQSYRVNQFVEKIQDRHEKLRETYEGKESAIRRQEITSMEGEPASIQLFSKFYDRLKEIKDYHSKFPNIENEVHEAQSILKGVDDARHKVISLFNSEEGFGRFLDLHTFYLQFGNLKGVFDSAYQVDYIQFLTSLLDGGYVPVPSAGRYSEAYLSYLNGTVEYLTNFLNRTNPLFDMTGKMAEITSTFEQQWKSQTFSPFYMELESNNSNDMEIDGASDTKWQLPWQINLGSSGSFFCPFCAMKLSKETVWKAHLASPKHEKAKTKRFAHIEAVSLKETVMKTLCELLHEALAATKANAEKKLSRRPGEAGYMRKVGDTDNADEDEVSDDEEPTKTRLTKKNYPIGPDGNPLPYWLYRLQGLSHEFKCQICGNASYFGRKAFERHFVDTRHTYGLSCLGLENSREFFEITSIEKALELGQRLKQLRTQGKWSAETMAEFEDAEGSVLDKATYDLLAKQFES